MSSANNTENIIAFMGVEGANADLACRQMHPYMETLGVASFEEVFKAVEEGRAKYGMIPIENSQAGRVAEIHNILPKTKLHIVGEHIQRIEHCLVAVSGTKKADIKEVYSHPQALLQTRQYCQKHGLEQQVHSNTATAARDVAQWGDASKAAISSNLAAELYGLEVLETNIEDDSSNSTLFITIAKDPVEPPVDAAHVLTSVCFTLRNIPSALYKAMGGFATNNINMIKLESYIKIGDGSGAQFFLTFEGHPHSRHVQLALEELGFFTNNVKLLGMYVADEKRYK